MVNVLCYHSSNYHIFSKKFDSIYVKRLVTRTECWRIWLREGKQQQKLPNKEIHFYQTLWPMEFPSHAHSVQFLTVSRKHDFNLFPHWNVVILPGDKMKLHLHCKLLTTSCDVIETTCFTTSKSRVFSLKFHLGQFSLVTQCTVSDVLYCKKKNQIHQRKEPRLASCTIRA